VRLRSVVVDFAALALLLALTGCNERQPAPPSATAVNHAQGLETREGDLRTQATDARVKAAEAVALADLFNGATTAEAITARQEAARWKARADALAAEAAATANANDHARQEAAEAARKDAQDAREAEAQAARERDRRLAWWIGVAGVGGGVLAGGLALWFGLSIAPGLCVVAAGITVAGFATVPAWALAICGAAVVVAFIIMAWGLRGAGRTAAAGWKAATAALDPTQRAELDRASRLSQTRRRARTVDALLKP
jgi:hypothetical protein